MDDLCRDQRTRWLAGERPTVEWYLARRPSLADRPDDVMELIYNEFLVREECGEPPASADFFRRFPAHRRSLERQLEVHRALQDEVETWGAFDSSRVDGPSHSGGLSHSGGGSQSGGGPAAPPTLRAEHEGAPRFELRGALGAGGMGVVHRVFDRRWGREAALKTLHRRDAAALQRLKEEFRLLADRTHPNLVQLYELFVEEGRAYFTMELVAGRDFAAWCAALRGDGAFSEERVRAAFVQLTEGLTALHSGGVLHCDLKPSNVLAADDGRVVLLDFGMAHDLRAAAGSDDARLRGTVAYLAPERLHGEPPSAAADWYAVGCMLYEALAGRKPYEADGAAQFVRAVLLGRPALPSTFRGGFSEALERLCLDWLSPDPALRPNGDAALQRLTAPPPKAVTAPSAPPLQLRTGDRTGDRPGDRTGDRPASAASDLDERLIGRDDALRVLRTALAEVVSEGRSDRLLVHGGSGSGKSALAARFTAEAEASGRATPLVGRCREYESIPFKAVDSLVDHLARRLTQRPDAEEAQALPPRGAAALADLFPALRRIPALDAARRLHGSAAPSDPVRRRAAAFEALGELLAALARRKPLVVWIDDVQWGDDDSGRLLVDTLRASESAPILWLACGRTERLAESPFLQQLRGALGPAVFREWKLPPLSPHASYLLAAAALADRGAAAEGGVDAAWIARQAEGNPFLLLELARSERPSAGPADRATHPAASAEGSDAPAEASARDDARADHVLAERIGRATPDAQALLHILAAAGGPLRLTTAARAAGVAGDPQKAAAELRAGRLIRTWRDEDAEFAEPYHDRIREGASRQASPEERRRRHAALAAALEAEPDPDPRALARSFDAAGAPEKAHQYAEAAGDAAFQAAAFDEARRFYELALAQPGVEAGRSRLERALADALVGAGRGADAGRIYRRLAASQPAAAAAELYTRAVENLVRSGRFKDGFDAFRDAATALGLICPRTPGETIRRILLLRAAIAFRGLGFVERREEEVDPALLARIDCCWTAGHLLGGGDVAGYSYFTMLHNWLALASGDRRRVARALGSVAFLRGSDPRRNSAHSQALLDRADEVALRSGDPGAGVGVAMFRAGLAFCAGDWLQVLAATDAAIPFLRDHAGTAAFELSWCYAYRLQALYCLGRWKALRREAAARLDDARARGDVLLSAEVRSSSTNTIWLAMDDPQAAERELAAALALRPEGLAPFVDLLARVHIDLYCGRGAAAWEAVTKAWPGLVAAKQLQIEVMLVEVSLIRIRAALASLAALPPAADSSPQERTLAEDLGVLLGSSYPWAPKLALLHRAGFAALRGRLDDAALWLAEAAAGLDAHGYALYAAAARGRLGELHGGPAGEKLLADAYATLSAEGVRRPDRMLPMLAPGFRPPASA